MGQYSILHTVHFKNERIKQNIIILVDFGRDLHFHFAITYIRDALAIIHTNLAEIPQPLFLAP